MEKLSFKVADFEGPLDLLLYLISKHKLNIYDIEISLLLEQYMEAIGELRLENMETASEFLEMASRLVYIKTATLLPKYEDEAADLKQELVGQLLEYQLCKEVAAELGERYQGAAVFVRQPAEIPGEKAYTRQHQPQEILKAYLLAVGRKRRLLPPPVSAFSGIIATRFVSVSSRIILILKRLYRCDRLPLADFFDACSDRSELVATFLAVLELTKSRRILLSDDLTAVTFQRDYRKLENLEQLESEVAKEGWDSPSSGSDASWESQQQAASIEESSQEEKTVQEEENP